MYTVSYLSLADAQEIAGWTYDPPYHIYNMSTSDDLDTMVRFLLDPTTGHFGVYDGASLLAFCCYGREGQVPGFDYDAQPALDIGVGMHPSFVGQGRGRLLLAAILAHGAALYHPSRWRATIAAFNQRSQQMFRNAGFVSVGEFVSTGKDPRSFIVFVKEVSGDLDRVDDPITG